MKDVIIIGAGIAGLSAAYELSKKQMDFQVLEINDRVGGNIQTIDTEGALVESGPYTFSSSSTEIMNLVKELGIEEQLLESNPSSKKRFIYLDSQLKQLPTGPIEFFKSDLLTKEGKWTLLEELFIKKEEKEESVEDFFTRRFGREIVKNIIQPFLNGIYAGDVKKLSINSVFPKLKTLEDKYKSVILGGVLSSNFGTAAKKMTLYSFIEGMEALPKTLYEVLRNKITLNVKNLEITRARDFFVVNFKSNNKTINYTASSILLAIPAHRVSNFNSIIPDEYISDFSQIEYVPVATVAQKIEKTKVDNNFEGFGFLCEREPHRKLLGTIWVSSIFPNRIQSDYHLLTSYIGGSYFKKVADLDDDETASLASKELSEILKLDQNLFETLFVKVHKLAIPQFNIGHNDRIKRIESLMNTNYGLYFTGNYLYGISINDTIKTSKQIVEKIQKFLNTVVKKQETLVIK